MRDLYGTVAGESALPGYLVTTGSIGDASYRRAQGKRPEPIDAERLVRLANVAR